MKSIYLIAVALFIVGSLAFAQISNSGVKNNLPDKINVPYGDANRIIIDGLFTEGEWADAVELKLTENVIMYMMVNKRDLYIGLRSIKPFMDALSELYFTFNEKEFINLHSSNAPAEGLNRYSESLKSAKFKAVNNNIYWDSNRGNSSRATYEGREYKINLEYIKIKPLKMSLLFAVIFNSTGSERETVKFAQEFSFKNSDSWVELILPKINKG